MTFFLQGYYPFLKKYHQVNYQVIKKNRSALEDRDNKQDNKTVHAQLHKKLSSNFV